VSHVVISSLRGSHGTSVHVVINEGTVAEVHFAVVYNIRDASQVCTLAINQASSNITVRNNKKACKQRVQWIKDNN